MNTLNQLVEQYHAAAAAYYSGRDELMNDSDFDTLVEQIRELSPDNEIFKSVGSPVATTSNRKTKLLFSMSSLDKVKNDSPRLRTFAKKWQKNNICITLKIDGMAGQLVFQNGIPASLTSRGDGIVGEDWSHLISQCLVLGERDLSIKAYGQLVVKVEIVMPKQVFKDKWASDFKTTRHAAAGLCNRHDHHPAQKDLRFIVHSAIDSNGNELSDQHFSLLIDRGAFNSYGIKSNKNITTDVATVTRPGYLSDLYKDWKDSSLVDSDGLVLKAIHNQPVQQATSNPEDAVAFKDLVENNEATTQVVRVIWSPTRHGTLFPQIEIGPVTIAGIEIRFVTGHNAKYIVDNKIGTGSQVVITRNNEVIPGIKKVITHCDEPSLPVNCVYEWCKDNNHFKLSTGNEYQNNEIRKAKILHFFSTIGVLGFGAKLAEKLAEQNENWQSVLEMTTADFVGINNMQLKSADKLVKSIHTAMRACTLAKFMDASGVMPESIGERRVEQLLEAEHSLVGSSSYNIYSFAFIGDNESDVNRIQGFKGFGPSIAADLVAGFDQFRRDIDLAQFDEFSNNDLKDFSEFEKSTIKTEPTGFLKNLCRNQDLVSGFVKDLSKAAVVGTSLAGCVFVWTGYRNSAQEQRVRDNGGTVGSSFSGKTTHLMIQDDAAETVKLQKARASGAVITTNNNFDSLFQNK